MSKVLDLRCDPLDAGGLQREVLRRDKIIHALMRQVEHNLSSVDTDFSLLQNTFVLEEQVRARTDELSRTLDELEMARGETDAASRRLETAVESIFEGFALFDPADRLLMCNDAFKRLWGLGSDVIGQPVEAFSAWQLPARVKTLPPGCSDGVKRISPARGVMNTRYRPGRTFRFASVEPVMVIQSGFIPT